MNIYIVEDDPGVIGTLEGIIESENLGTVCGTNGGKAVTVGDIHLCHPDVVLVDFLMPEKDGVEVVRELREAGCQAKIIMLSQVTDKELVAKAYREGIDFFVNKPINLVEMRSVLNNVGTQIKNEQTIKNIRQLFQNGENSESASPVSSGFETAVRSILSRLGMSGEKGTDDIVRICLYLNKSGLSIGSIGIGALCKKLDSQPRNMEQRIRRAIGVGMSNMANLGLEDFLNETFETYSSRLFSFEEIRAEMDYIRGKSPYNGKINIKKFIDGLMLEGARKN